MRGSATENDATTHAGTVVLAVGTNTKCGLLSHLPEEPDFEIRHWSKERLNFTHDFEP
jgi:hypothetical protein